MASGRWKPAGLHRPLANLLNELLPGENAIMPITISCPSCRRQLRVPDDLLGKTVRCPGCQSTFTAEDPDAVADVDVIEEEKPQRRPTRGTEPPRTEGEEIEAEARSARRRRRREEEDEEADYREYEDDLEDD